MEQNKKERKFRIIVNIIRIIFIIILIISMIDILNWFKNNQETENIMNEISSALVVEVIEDVTDNANEVDVQIDQDNKIKEEISLENQIISAETEETKELLLNEDKEKKYRIDFEYLKTQNSDVIGWIKVEGTNIEYPVVKSSDNSYYLNHNLYKNKSKAGWVFADYRNKFDGNDKNIIIYGHNRRDDSMFATLKNVFSSTWYTKEENKNIIFITENEYSVYRTFSIYQTQDSADSYYITTDFYDLEYEAFLEKIKNRSVVDFKEELNDNSILTLSTCTDNSKYRIVLHAQKIENE